MDGHVHGRQTTAAANLSSKASSTGTTLDHPNDVTTFSPLLLRGEHAWSPNDNDDLSSVLSSVTAHSTLSNLRRRTSRNSRTTARQAAAAYQQSATAPMSMSTRELLMQMRMMNAQLGRGHVIGTLQPDPRTRVEPVLEDEVATHSPTVAYSPAAAYAPSGAYDSPPFDSPPLVYSSPHSLSGLSSTSFAPSTGPSPPQPSLPPTGLAPQFYMLTSTELKGLEDEVASVRLEAEGALITAVEIRMERDREIRQLAADAAAERAIIEAASASILERSIERRAHDTAAKVMQREVRAWLHGRVHIAREVPLAWARWVLQCVVGAQARLLSHSAHPFLTRRQWTRGLRAWIATWRSRRRVIRALGHWLHGSCARAVATWAGRLDETRHEDARRLVATHAVRRCMHSLLRGGIGRWRRRTVYAQLLRHTIRLGTGRSCYRRLTAGVRSWQCNVRGSIHLRRAATHALNRGVVSSLHKWTRHATRLRTTVRLVRRVVALITLQEAVFAIVLWVAAVQQRHRLKVSACASRHVLSRQNHRTLGLGFRSWVAVRRALASQQHKVHRGSLRGLERRLLATWRLWAREATASSAHRNRLRFADGRYKRGQLVRAYRRWRLAPRLQSLLLAAEIHSIQSILLYAWRGWARQAAARSAALTRLRRACHLLLGHQLAMCFAVWHSRYIAASQRQAMAHAMSCAVQTTRHLQTARAWRGWVELGAARRRSRRGIASLRARDLNACVCTWRARTHAAVLQRMSTVHVRGRRLRRLKRDTWRQWVRTATSHAASTVERRRSVGYIQRRELLEAFATWQGMAPLSSLHRVGQQYHLWQQRWRYWIRWVASRHAAIRQSIRIIPLTMLGMRKRLGRAWLAWLHVIKVAAAEGVTARLAIAFKRRRGAAWGRRRWREYLSELNAVRECMAVASSAFVQTHLQSGFRVWRGDTVVGRCLRSNDPKLQVLPSVIDRALRRGWHWWRVALHGAYVHAVMHAFSVRVPTAVMTRVWVVWMASNVRVLHLRLISATAIMLTARRRLLLGMGAWLTNMRDQAAHTSVVHSSTALLVGRRVRGAFAAIVLAASCERERRRHLQLSISMCCTVAFDQWQAAVSAQRLHALHAAQMANAISYMTHRDVANGWRQWYLTWESGRYALTVQQYAVATLRSLRVARCWRAWRFEVAQATDSVQSAEHSISFISRRRLAVRLADWRRCTQRTTEAKQAAASDARVLRATLRTEMTKCWMHWRREWAARVHVRTACQQGVHRWRHGELVDAWRFWAFDSRQRVTVNSRLRSIVPHASDPPLVFRWRVWRTVCTRRVAAIARARVAVLQLTGRQLAVGWHGWRAFADETHAHLVGLRSTMRLLSSRLMRQLACAMRTWLEYSSGCSKDRRRLRSAASAFVSRTLAFGWHVWAQVVHQRTRTPKLMVRSVTYATRMHVAYAFNGWACDLDEIRRASKRSALAMHALTQLTHRKIRHGWILWQARWVTRRRREAHMRRAAAHLLHQTLAAAWRPWVEAATSRATGVQSIRRSVSFALHRDLALSFSAWRNQRLQVDRAGRATRHAIVRSQKRAWARWQAALVGIGISATLRWMLGRMRNRDVARVWQTWADQGQLRTTSHRSQRRGLAYFFSHQLAGGFAPWAVWAASRRGLRWKAHAAYQMMLNRHLASSFSQWREPLRERREDAFGLAPMSSPNGKMARATLKCYSSNLRRGWALWYARWLSECTVQHGVTSRVNVGVRMRKQLLRAFRVWVHLINRLAGDFHLWRQSVGFLLAHHCTSAFGQWRAGALVQRREDAQTLVLLRTYAHHNFHTLRRGWRGITAACGEWSSLCALLQRAIIFLLRRRFAGAWNAWRSAAVIGAAKAQALHKAIRFFATRNSAQSFHTWARVVVLRVAIATAARRGFERSLTDAWQCWCGEASSRARWVNVVSYATMRVRQRTLLDGWRAWVVEAGSVVTSMQRASSARRFSIGHGTELGFRSWVEAAVARATALQSLRRAAIAIVNHVMLNGFVAWRELAQLRARSPMARALLVLDHRGLARVYRCWRSVAATRGVRRRAVRSGVSRVFCRQRSRAWSAWTAMAVERMRTSRVVRHAIGFVSMLKSARAFFTWVDGARLVRQRAVIARQCSDGVLHYVAHVSMYAIRSWQAACHARRAKNLRRGKTLLVQRAVGRLKLVRAWSDLRAQSAPLSLCRHFMRGAAYRRISAAWWAWMGRRHTRAALLATLFRALDFHRLRIFTAWRAWVDFLANHPMTRVSRLRVNPAPGRAWRTWKSLITEQAQWHAVVRDALMRWLYRQLFCAWHTWIGLLQDVAAQWLVLQRCVGIFSHQVVATTIRQWLQYLEYRHLRAARATLMDRALRVYFNVKLAAAWRSWQEEHTTGRRRYESLMRCILQCTSRKLAGAWRMWADCSRSQTAIVASLRAVVLQLTRLRLALAWRTWHSLATAHSTQCRSLNRAERLLTSFQTRLMARAWHKWMAMAMQLSSSKERHRTAARILKLRALAFGWRTWLAMVRRREAEVEGMRSMENSPSPVLFSMARSPSPQLAMSFRVAMSFRAWAKSAMERAVALHTLCRSVAAIMRHQLVEGLGVWRQWVIGASLPRIASQFDRCQKLWRLWMRWAAYRLDSLQMTLRLVPCELIARRQSKGRAWRMWTSSIAEVAASVQSTRQVVSLISTRALARCWRTWAGIATEQTADRTSQRTSLDLFVGRTTAQAFRSWAEAANHATATLRIIQQVAESKRVRQVTRGSMLWAAGAQHAKSDPAARSRQLLISRWLAMSWRVWQVEAGVASVVAILRHAVSHLRNRMLSRSWNTWMQAAKETALMTQRVREGSSSIINRHTALAFSSWCAAHKSARVLAEQAVAMSHAIRFLRQINTARGWMTWKGLWKSAKRIRAKVRKATSKLPSSPLPQRWKQWAAMVASKRAIASAQRIWSRRALSGAWQSWASALSNDGATSALRKIAHRKLGFAFPLWRQYTAHAIEMGRATRFLWQIKTARGWMGWKRRWKAAMRAHSKIAHAVSYWRGHQLGRGFRSWIRVVETQEEGGAILDALYWRWSRRSLTHALREWRALLDDDTLHVVMQLAEGRMRARLLVRGWAMWRQNVTALVASIHRLSKGFSFTLARRMLLAFNTWHTATDDERRNADHEAGALRSVMHMKLARGWLHWRAMLKATQLLAARSGDATAQLRRHAISRAWNEWRSARVTNRDSSQRLARAFERLLHRQLSRAWAMWSEQATETILASLQVRHSIGRMLNRRVARAVATWRAAVASAKSKPTAVPTVQVPPRLSHLVVRMFWRRWMAKFGHWKVWQLNLARILLYMVRRHLRGVWREWRAQMLPREKDDATSQSASLGRSASLAPAPAASRPKPRGDYVSGVVENINEKDRATRAARQLHGGSMLKVPTDHRCGSLAHDEPAWLVEAAAALAPAAASIRRRGRKASPEDALTNSPSSAGGGGASAKAAGSPSAVSASTSQPPSSVNASPGAPVVFHLSDLKTQKGRMPLDLGEMLTRV